MSEFSFKGVEAAKSASFLEPGFYYLSVSDAKLETPEGKNPFISVTFSGEKGSVTTKLFITPKALPRLQYIYNSYMGKPCDKDFENAAAVGAFFTKFFESDKIRAIKKGMAVGGKQVADGTVYSDLPYTDFFMPEDMNFAEGPFDRGTANWARYVKLDTSNPSVKTDNVMMPATEGPAANEAMDDLPF